MNVPKGGRLIWTSRPDYEDWREAVEEQCPDACDEERYDFMMGANRDQLQFEREELSHRYPENILVIADLGLWNGRFPAYREITSRNLADCLVPTRDTLDIQWYLDKYGDLRADDAHHDGVNHYLYRVWNPGADQNQKDRLKEKILAGTVSERDLDRVTKRLGEEIARVYGWSPGRRKREREYER